VGASETLRTIARCEYSSLQCSVGSKRVGEKQSGNERVDARTQRKLPIDCRHACFIHWSE